MQLSRRLSLALNAEAAETVRSLLKSGVAVQAGQ